MAPLIITKSSSDITVRDFNCVNSVPVMKIAAEIEGHLTPEEGSTLYDHSALSICSEDTPMVKPADDIYNKSNGGIDRNKFEKVVESGRVFTPEESAWLLKSSIFNERGHAIATLGDRIVFENVRVRGNQDSIWASDGRVYFKNCTLIGGTDYIYGSAAAVFDNCKLGFAGFTDYSYGNPLGTPNTDKSRNYGYLFWNCTIYNECDNGGESNFGGPWGDFGQSTFYNTLIDDNGTVGNSGVKIAAKGWGRFGAENGISRLYEYGTKNTSGKAADLSKRIKNKSVEEGGPGMGTVLDEWQILEFNPRNYFSSANTADFKDAWDPMGFANELAEVDAAIAAATVTIPSNEETTFALPQAPAGITFKWESASTNAVVSADGKNITVIRPAAGEESISSSVTLYAMDNENKIGDKKEIPVIITPTTNTTDVFNIPVNITSTAALEEDSDYNITISYNGAVIKKQTVTVPAGATTVSATIENVPATTAGIDYDIKIVPESNEVTIVTPADGIKKIKGIIGQNVNLDIATQGQMDYTLDLGINYSSTDGVKKYDLIELVNAELAKLSDTDDSVMTSDQISVSYNLDVSQETTGSGYIDILASEPANTCNTGAVNSRFLLGKLGHWNQLDYVDSAQGYSGSSNGPDQWLNACGKFNTSVLSTTSVNIDYKTQTISASGSGTGQKEEYTFATFPSQYEKGKLYLAIYPGNEKFEIRDVTVTYKRVIKEGVPIVTQPPKATATPKPTEDPSVAYGTVEENADGSMTMYFGTKSIAQSNSQAKMVSDTVNGVSLIRPDYFYPGSNGYGELKLSEIDLKNSGYDKVEFVLANKDTSDVVIKVGGTQVASFTGVTTGGWSPFKTFAADLSTTDVSGSVTIESTVTDGQFCGNFAYVRFFKSN